MKLSKSREIYLQWQAILLNGNKDSVVVFTFLRRHTRYQIRNEIAINLWYPLTSPHHRHVMWGENLEEVVIGGPSYSTSFLAVFLISKSDDSTRLEPLTFKTSS